MDASTNYLGLSDNAVLLLAANLASIPQLSSLRDLIAGYPDVLHFTAVLEILLKIVPETTSPEDYVPIVYHSYRREIGQFDMSRISTSAVDEVQQLSTQNVKRRLTAFDLQPTPKSHPHAEEDEKLLTQWFFDRARRVEEATGMIDLARRLVLPDTTNFSQDPAFPPSAVTAWGKGVVQVLETFIFDNDDEDELQLLPFENLDPDSAIRLLMSRSTPDIIARNVKTLIIPFIDYIRSKEPNRQLWATLWDWLLDKASAGELSFISNLTGDWVPDDETVLRQFLQTCLTASYLCHQTSSSIRQNLRRIQQNILRLSQILPLPESQPIVLHHPETDLLPSQLRESSSLTTLSRTSLTFLDQIIQSADVVAQYHGSPDMSLRDIIMIREGPEPAQSQLLDRLLRSEQTWNKRNDEQWRKLRQSLKWLHNQSRVLGKISDQSLDTRIFTAMLDATGISIEDLAYSSIYFSEGDVCSDKGITSRSS